MLSVQEIFEMTQEVAVLEAQQIELAGSRDYAGVTRLQVDVERLTGQIKARAHSPRRSVLARRFVGLLCKQTHATCSCSTNIVPQYNARCRDLRIRTHDTV